MAAPDHCPAIRPPSGRDHVAARADQGVDEPPSIRSRFPRTRIGPRAPSPPGIPAVRGVPPRRAVPIWTVCRPSVSSTKVDPAPARCGTTSGTEPGEDPGRARRSRTGWSGPVKPLRRDLVYGCSLDHGPSLARAKQRSPTRGRSATSRTRTGRPPAARQARLVGTGIVGAALPPRRPSRGPFPCEGSGETRARRRAAPAGSDFPGVGAA